MELFPEESTDYEYENELLQTIYFPKKVKNIGYLTDKLPTARYEERLARTERKLGSSDTVPSPNNGGTERKRLPSLNNVSKVYKVSAPKDKSPQKYKVNHLKSDESNSGHNVSTVGSSKGASPRNVEIKD